MIIEWFFTLGSTITAWFADLLPNWTPPAFLTEFPGLVNSFTSMSAGMGVWVDFAYIIGVVAVVITTWGIGLAVKVARSAGTHLPFIGGNG